MGKNSVGEMVFRFYSRNEVSITDTIPDAPDPSVNYPLWFAFMFAGRMFFNFPGDSGVQAALDGANRLAGVFDPDRPFDKNPSLLGTLSSGALGDVMMLGGAAAYAERLLNPLRFVNERAGKAREYRGVLVWKGESLVVDTKIALGDEDYYHRASIEAALEVVRQRLGRNGGIVSTLASLYFAQLAQGGTRDLRRNLDQAATLAAFGAPMLAERVDPLSDWSRAAGRATSQDDDDESEEGGDLPVYFGIGYARSEQNRVVVNEIDADSPAAKGGLEVGDTITAVDSDQVGGIASFDALLSRRAPGDVVGVTVTRSLSLSVKLGNPLDD